ncbi:MAG: serine hydrolase [Bacteroidota bacterium]|nr:serine hydrolase [Bacteroidota bacterium]
MKFLKIVLGSALIITVNSCQVGRFIWYNFADVNDHKIFDDRILQAPPTKFTFFEPLQEKAPKTIHIQNKEIAFDGYLKTNKTLAFLIIKNDTLLYERYFDTYSKESIVPSFSVAKSITSILIGCAIDDKLIKNIDEPITNYIPELTKNGFEKVSIKHVLQMTSGLNFNESYVNPFGHAASFYYGLNLRKSIAKLTLKELPGTQFDYVSGNTQLLGLILERALKGKNVTQYLQEKLWEPLGMEYSGSWSIDSEKSGLEKTFCCLNARARDFAKIGRLYLQKGNWNGKQIVSEKWVKESTQVKTSEGSASYYQYQWWLPSRDGDFMAHGILGQYIYVNPSKNMVIVRLGSSEGNANWDSLFMGLAEAY